MLVGGKWFWCCKDNIIFPLRHHRTARVFPTPRAFSVRPPHSTRWVAPNCALLTYLFTSSTPSSAFSCFSPPPFGTKRRTSGTFHSKVPRFLSKVPHFRAFTPAFCRAPHTAHPPCAIRCIFPPHLRSATGVKRTSSIYSCTHPPTPVCFSPSAVAKSRHFSPPCAPRLVFSPPSLSNFSFNSSNPSSHVRLLR